MSVEEKPSGYDAEMEAIMKQKFSKLQETQQDPQARASLLVKKYVDVLDRLLGGTKSYDADYEELTQIREQATAWGLKFTFDVKVASVQ